MVLSVKKKVMVMVAVLFIIVVGAIAMGGTEPAVQVQEAELREQVISLPSPRHTGELSVEEAIFRRRSIRHFPDEPLTLQEVS